MKHASAGGLAKVVPLAPLTPRQDGEPRHMLEGLKQICFEYERITGRSISKSTISRFIAADHPHRLRVTFDVSGHVLCDAETLCAWALAPGERQTKRRRAR